MDRSLRLRSFGFAAIVLYCLLYLVPTFVDSERIPSWFFFDHKITLGLDLQGGAQFTYSIALDKAVDDKAAEIRRDVEAELAEKKIAGTASTPDIAPGAIAITLKDPTKKDEVSKLVASRYGDIITTMSCPAQGPLKDSLCVRIASSYADGIKKSALKQAVGTIKKRIDARGVAEPTVIEKDDQIIVELPGLDKDNIARIKELIARTAKLEFKIVGDGSPWMSGLYQQVVKPDPAAEALGITAHPDAWAHEKSGKEFFDSYLKAYDRDESFTVAEAQKSGCYRRDMPEKDGKVRCKVTGRRVIERYLEELAAANPQFHAPPERIFAFLVEQ